MLIVEIIANKKQIFLEKKKGKKMQLQIAIQLLFLHFSTALGASPMASDPFIIRKRLHESTNMFHGTSPTSIQSPSLSS
nr:hypothetical protein MtrunA17_Chr1g0187931 [Ipomoea batatas]